MTTLVLDKVTFLQDGGIYPWIMDKPLAFHLKKVTYGF